MDKLSAEQIDQVLSEVPGVIRSIAGERDFYRDKLAQYERRQSAEKIATEMHSKGIDLDTPADALADRIEKAAEQGKLETIQAAVDMVGPDMGTKLAQLSNDDRRITAGSSDFERFIVGGVG